MPIHGRECAACEAVYEVLTIDGETVPLESVALGCPLCGAEEFVALAGGALGVDLGTDAGVGRSYPYFDRMLQQEVRSEEHRATLLAAKGWEPTYGDFDAAEVESREQTKRDAFEAEYQAEQDYLLNGPNKAKNRRALDIIAAEGEKLWEGG